MNIIKIFSSSFVLVVIILISFGAIFGVVSQNTDLVNFMRNRAIADQIEAETDFETQKHAIEIDFYPNEAKAKSELAIAKIAQEILEIEIQNEEMKERSKEKVRFESEIHDLILGFITHWWLLFPILIGFTLVKLLGRILLSLISSDTRMPGDQVYPVKELYYIPPGGILPSEARIERPLMKPAVPLSKRVR